jgi:hypothetical protein
VYFALALQNRPETCVTAKGNPYDSSALVLRTMMRYALERELYRGSTSAISIELPKRRNVSFRTLPRVRSVTANRLSMDQSLQREWARRVAKSQQ